MGCGLVPSVIFGLIIHALIKCHPQGQFLGGRRNFQAADSYSNGVNLGGLGVSSTLSDNRGYNNGRFSGGISHDLGVGPLGIGTSLSIDNLKKGTGLHRNSDGGVGLGLGLLDLELQRNHGVAAQTSAGATGQYSNSRSQAGSRGYQLGLLGINSAHSNSRAMGYNSPQRYGRRRRSVNLNSKKISSLSASQEKIDSKQMNPLNIELFGKTLLPGVNQNKSSSEKLLLNEIPEQRGGFETFFDLIFRLIAANVNTAVQVFFPMPVQQTSIFTPVSCCTTCQGIPCSPATTGTIGITHIPVAYPGINFMTSPQQGGGILYTSSSSTNSIGSGGPITIYGSSNSQTGIQVG